MCREKVPEFCHRLPVSAHRTSTHHFCFCKILCKPCQLVCIKTSGDQQLLKLLNQSIWHQALCHSLSQNRRSHIVRILMFVVNKYQREALAYMQAVLMPHDWLIAWVPIKVASKEIYAMCFLFVCLFKQNRNVLYKSSLGTVQAKCFWGCRWKWLKMETLLNHSMRFSLQCCWVYCCWCFPAMERKKKPLFWWYNAQPVSSCFPWCTADCCLSCIQCERLMWSAERLKPDLLGPVKLEAVKINLYVQHLERLHAGLSLFFFPEGSFNSLQTSMSFSPVS